MGGCSRGHNFMLLLYALGYLGLMFIWVLLVLGFLTWCQRSNGFKAFAVCWCCWRARNKLCT